MYVCFYVIIPNLERGSELELYIIFCLVVSVWCEHDVSWVDARFDNRGPFFQSTLLTWGHDGAHEKVKDSNTGSSLIQHTATSEVSMFTNASSLEKFMCTRV